MTDWAKITAGARLRKRMRVKRNNKIKKQIQAGQPGTLSEETLKMFLKLKERKGRNKTKV